MSIASAYQASGLYKRAVYDRVLVIDIGEAPNCSLHEKALHLGAAGTAGWLQRRTEGCVLRTDRQN